MTTAKEIIERIRNCSLNDEEQWLQIDKDVDDFLEKATREDVKYLNNHWAEMELLNNVALVYKMMRKNEK